MDMYQLSTEDGKATGNPKTFEVRYRADTHWERHTVMGNGFKLDPKTDNVYCRTGKTQEEFNTYCYVARTIANGGIA